MITKYQVEQAQSKVTEASQIYANQPTNKNKDNLDKALESLVKVQGGYNNQPKTITITYSIGIRPCGDYEGEIEVFENATSDEIRRAIYDAVEFFVSAYHDGVYIL